MNETGPAIKSGFRSADENYGNLPEVADLTMLSPTSAATIKRAGDAGDVRDAHDVSAYKTATAQTRIKSSGPPLVHLLDPADYERLVRCASIIRLRGANAADWITPWCNSDLPHEVMAKARVGSKRFDFRLRSSADTSSVHQPVNDPKNDIN